MNVCAWKNQVIKREYALECTTTWYWNWSAGAADATIPPMLTPTALPLVLADAAATPLFTSAPLPLVLADAAAATFFTAAPLPLVLTDAATDTALHSLLYRCCSCNLLHRSTLSPSHSPTRAYIVFGGSRIREIISWKQILYIQNFMVLNKCTVCFTRRHFSYRELRVNSAVDFFVLFVVIAKNKGVGRSSFVTKGPKQIHRTM